MKRRSISIPIMIILICGLLSGCGHGKSRVTQDWSGVTDFRIKRTCHVTNYGSGYVIAQRDKKVYVLTPAHVAWRFDSLPVYLHVENGYKKYTGKVVAKSNSGKVDLALLEIDCKIFKNDFRLDLAESFENDEVRNEIQLVDVTGLNGPTIVSGGAIENDILWSGQLDDWGRTYYVRDGVLMFGGIVSANSGSPVFYKEQFVGINLMSMTRFEMYRDERGRPLTRHTHKGIQITDPLLVLKFLQKHHLDHRLIATVGGEPYDPEIYYRSQSQRTENYAKDY